MLPTPGPLSSAGMRVTDQNDKTKRPPADIDVPPGVKAAVVASIQAALASPPPAGGAAPAAAPAAAPVAAPESKPETAPLRARPAPAPQRPQGPRPVAADPAPPVEGGFHGAGGARFRLRHGLVLASFVALVVAPLMVAAWYLYSVAVDQYASRVGFSVQREEAGSAIEFLGGITEISGSSSSDTDILYRFIQSREMVRSVDARLDLRAVWAQPGDPAFGLAPGGTIEDLEAHWNRKVDVFYDTSSRLIEVRALAFRPEDATAIGRAIFDESTRMLNNLSAIAREDSTRYARAELDVALERLKRARQALTTFRMRTQIVDPEADIQGRMGLLNMLLAQQAAALIDLDMLSANTGATDPRYLQAQKRVDVIEARILAERARFGEQSGPADEAYATQVAEFEALMVDLEFAQGSYLSARAAHDAALAEAQRNSRYLATYLSPTMAERAEYPQRWMILLLLGAALMALWSIGVLVYYALRDRR